MKLCNLFLPHKLHSSVMPHSLHVHGTWLQFLSASHVPAPGHCDVVFVIDNSWWKTKVLLVIFLVQLFFMFNLLNQIVELWIRHLNISGEVPTEMDHWNDWLVTLKFIPLIANYSQFVLSCGQWTYIPCDIIAPADCLNPVNATAMKIKICF